MSHALVNQPGFLAAGNDINRKTQCFLAALEEFFAVDGFTQGLGGNRPDLRFFESRQPFTEAGQAIPAALHGLRGQVAVGIKSVALAHGFLEVLNSVDAAVVEAANFKTKAVGPQVHSGKQCSVLHV